MKITSLKTNRISNPLGFAMHRPVLSWIVEDTPDKVQTAAHVRVSSDADFKRILYDSGKVMGTGIDSLGFCPDLTLTARTRYFWQVRVWGETEQAESEVAWFETAKMDEPWSAQWIMPELDDNQIHPYLFKSFELPVGVVAARAYICGLGLYHLELNGRKAGDEVLAPGCNAYDQWLQYQTYDITGQLQTGSNLVTVMLGNGWYKGRYGLQDGPTATKPYGDRFACICEIHVRLESGEMLIILSDCSWKARPAPVLASSIYDGETFDSRIMSPIRDTQDVWRVIPAALDNTRLEARRSLPVFINELVKPVAVIHTPTGETVLDMGQNMVGWLRFKTCAPAGTRIHLQYGEVLQNGCFYQENLRTAKAEYTWIANGEEMIAEPYFTFYGFRYVKVTGWDGELELQDFTGCVVYSRMDLTGEIETSNEKVNRLFKNAQWGQKGNFLDIPTDCPQRDERLGWTGDTQVFSGTACFNMDSAAFFAKYAYDLAKEQVKFRGMVPYFVPAVNSQSGGSSAWGDVATILPWNVYEFYGDKAILEQQLWSMRAWVDFIKAADEASGGKRLWTTGFHFGDWLALDGNDPNSPLGGTPEDFISSAYYYYSARLTARAATVLGMDQVAEQYTHLASEVKAAIQQEYFTATGRLAINTQTGFVLALFMELAPEAFCQRLVNDLVLRLRKDKVNLRTGFVGTPYLCRVLSRYGANDLAYRLLLNEDYPSWLYAVNLGATTIWERWNSLNPDGTISSTGMNSLNHYAYGSIVEWMYRDMCGLNPSMGDDQVTGFRHACLAPKPDKALRWARARYRSAAGWYDSGWQIDGQGRLIFDFAIPFNATARIVLPDARVGEIVVNGEVVDEGRQVEDCVELEVSSGKYAIAYQPTRKYVEVFSIDTPIVRLVRSSKVVAALAEAFPMITKLDESILVAIGDASIRDMAQTPFLQLSEQQLYRLDQQLKEL